ncbi:MAG: glycosyltransferase family 4 protein [Roseovarius sp.]
MAEAQPLRLAYLCDQDPEDHHSYSGGNLRLLAALRAHVGDVTVLGSGWHAAQPARTAIEALPEALTIRARWRAHLMLARIIARGVEAELRAGQYDAVFCAYGFQSLAGLRLPYPMLRVFTSDATPTVYKQSEIGATFGSYLKLSRWLDPQIQKIERAVLQKCDLLLWPSAWLKSEADRLHDLRPERSLIVPWGANVDDPGPPTPVPLRRDGPVKLLVLGRDWVAKGGPVAFETMQILRAAGHDARLTVIGCIPPEAHCTEHVTVHGHLDKSIPTENAVLTDALRTAHFMVMPSFESYGFAFCEASAYGMPSLCLDVGGVPVRDGVNGHSLAPDRCAEDFAAHILRYIRAPKTYDALRETTRQEYETRLNWRVWGETTRAHLIRARAALLQG